MTNGQRVSEAIQSWLTQSGKAVDDLAVGASVEPRLIKGILKRHKVPRAIVGRSTKNFDACYERLSRFMGIETVAFMEMVHQDREFWEKQSRETDSTKILQATVTLTLRTFMSAKRKSIRILAKEMNVDRNFIAGLMDSAQVPVRNKMLQTAAFDDRYEKLADYMGIDRQAFIELVTREQEAHPPRKAHKDNDRSLEVTVNKSISVIQDVAIKGEGSAAWREDLAKKLTRLAAALRA